MQKEFVLYAILFKLFTKASFSLARSQYLNSWVVKIHIFTTHSPVLSCLGALQNVFPTVLQRYAMDQAQQDDDVFECVILVFH